MNWRSTWTLVALAAGLFVFIVLVERRLRPTYQAGTPPARLLSFKAAEVTNLHLRITNQPLLRVERDATADAAWYITVPTYYPAQGPAIEWLLRSLEELAPLTFIPRNEMTAGKRTLADFGLDLPRATVTLYHAGKRTEVLFGSKTPIGDQVYLQTLDQSGVYLVPAELFDRLPRNHHDWRDSMLFTAGKGFNRVDVRAPGRGYTLEVTNMVLMVTRPTLARADPSKFTRLMQKVQQAQVIQFVSDHPRADLEQYGLQPPELEVAFGMGTNEVVVVQFGRSPTNDPTAVYARRLAQTNVVLTSRETLEAFQTTFSELRDLHLVTIPPGGIDSIEVIGTENFTVRRMTNGTWAIGDNAAAPAVPADAVVMREWIDDLARLEGVVEKDVVTDFKTQYMLDPPGRQYVLRMGVTNANGAVSNYVVGTLQLGARQGDKVFARRPDEAVVYSLPPKDVARLPYAAWQLRDRRVWSFTTNQVAQLTVRRGGTRMTIQRSLDSTWKLAEGTVGIVRNTSAIEEILYRLGELRASVWVAQGADKKALFGFQDTGDQVTIELRNGDKPRVLTLEFGGRSPNGLPYAMAVFDGQTFIFEFPPAFYFELLRNLINQMVPAAN